MTASNSWQEATTRYIDWHVSRAERNLRRIQTDIEEVLPISCLTMTILALELTGRSYFEREVESLCFALWRLLSSLCRVDGVLDISVGPFQIRPSSAFTWRRRSFLNLPVAFPDHAGQGLAMCSQLFQVKSAAALVGRILGAMQDCDDEQVLNAVGVYCGSRPDEASVDARIAILVHRHLHKEKSAFYGWFGSTTRSISTQLS